MSDLTYADGWRSAIESRIGALATPCKRCSGLGVRTYGSASTWRGGPGGSVMTRDTCNLCWGSGDASRPGVDLKRYAAAMRELERLRERVKKMEPEA